MPLTPAGEVDLALAAARGQQREIAVFEQRVRFASEVLARIQKARHGEKAGIYAEISADAGVKAGTLRRWATMLKEGGRAALLPVSRPERGQFSSIPKGLGNAILEAWLDECARTVAQVFRHVVRPWCVNAGIDAPCERTVARFVEARTRPMERVFFRRGRKAWEGEIAARVLRDIETAEVNGCWVADHRLLDLFVVLGGKPVRPWITQISRDCSIITESFYQEAVLAKWRIPMVRWRALAWASRCMSRAILPWMCC